MGKRDAEDALNERMQRGLDLLESRGGSLLAGMSLGREMKLTGKLHEAEQENARLRAEVERLKTRGCSDCSSSGQDGSNPCCSCRGTGSVAEARLECEVERLRSALVRVQSAIATRWDMGSGSASFRCGLRVALDYVEAECRALTREDGEGS